MSPLLYPAVVSMAPPPRVAHESHTPSYPLCVQLDLQKARGAWKCSPKSLKVQQLVSEVRPHPRRTSLSRLAHNDPCRN